jgi:nuclear protein localization family protein 4
VDYQAANAFQSYLQEHRFRIQRCGFLYGKYNDDGSSSVEAIYEPPQRCEKDQIVMLSDPDEDRVEKIASLLGFTRVGWIFSHPARSYVMSSVEIRRAAEFQIKYGERFVTLILSVNEKGQGNLEAFQVSDQAVKLAQQNTFLPSDDPAKCRFRQPVYVEGAETTIADYHFFLVTVSVKSKDKGLLRADFPVENRERPQSRSDLKVHLMHHAKRPFIEQVSDFHFLLFLSKGYLDLNTDFPTLCDALISKKPQDLEGFKFLLDNYLK